MNPIASLQVNTASSTAPREHRDEGSTKEDGIPPRTEPAFALLLDLPTLAAPAAGGTWAGQLAEIPADSDWAGQFADLAWEGDTADNGPPGAHLALSDTVGPGFQGHAALDSDDPLIRQLVLAGVLAPEPHTTKGAESSAEAGWRTLAWNQDQARMPMASVTANPAHQTDPLPTTADAQKSALADVPRDGLPLLLRREGLTADPESVGPLRALAPELPLSEPRAITLAHTVHDPAAARTAPPVVVTLPRGPAGDAGEFAEQVGTRLTWMANQQVGRAQILISPPHLGAIEIDLQIEGNRVRAEINSSNAEVRALIEAGLPRLREMFASQGMTLLQTDVGENPPSGARADTRGGGDGHRGEQARDGEGPREPGKEKAAAESATRVAQRSANGLLDEYA